MTAIVVSEPAFDSTPGDLRSHLTGVLAARSIHKVCAMSCA